MSEGEGETPFASMEDLNLMETKLAAWESVDALTQWFPALKSLRLGKDIPLLKVGDGLSSIPPSIQIITHPSQIRPFIHVGSICSFFHHL